MFVLPWSSTTQMVKLESAQGTLHWNKVCREIVKGIFWWNFFKWFLLNTLWLREIFSLSNLWILKMSHVWQRWFSSRQRRDKFHQDRQKSNQLPSSFNEGYKNPRQTFPESSWGSRLLKPAVWGTFCINTSKQSSLKLVGKAQQTDWVWNKPK